jgi:hypothetical protein
MPTDGTTPQLAEWQHRYALLSQRVRALAGSLGDKTLPADRKQHLEAQFRDAWQHLAAHARRHPLASQRSVPLR